ncbi:choline ABC transporter ATP-binding protein [Dongia sedimenti]|uniref:Choline ABC transporter ATP-binding protein n=1 Tax=Dongia sedimenti TaxID=3064282 RepID=A0ABU0YM83_9PROT|nr:choline ABC transporter ATP-binding protein [Rhodospirillaceae bacterium R-7]
MTGSNAVRFEHVDVVFGQHAAEAIALLDKGEGRDAILDKTGSLVGVHDASVFVDKGEILVLMGLSGSGKSSLLRCVNGLNKVSRGKVIVNDGKREIDVASCNGETLRQVRRNNISMVFQQFGLMPWLTVHENVGFGLDVRGMSKAERDRVVDEKISLVRLNQFAHKFPHELSGGMQQRVGLARAFATEADILLMDEPFSALDPLIREHLQDELIELQRRLHKTIVFVSHDLDEALKIGSRIAIMEAGRVVQFGRPEDIILNPVNDYVRQFVASMNPLTVLKGGTLMRPVSDLAREAGSTMIQLDRAGKCRCRLDGQGKPTDLIVNGKPGQFLPYATDLALERLGDNVMICGTPVTPMRAAVMVRQQTKRPLVLLGDNGELIGVVGEHELYRGMLRQTEYARVNQSPPPTVETP